MTRDVKMYTAKLRKVNDARDINVNPANAERVNVTNPVYEIDTPEIDTPITLDTDTCAITDIITYVTKLF